MVTCVKCGLQNVDETAPARYDGFAVPPGQEVKGPYCSTCWPTTPSGIETQRRRGKGYAPPLGVSTGKAALDHNPGPTE